MVTSCVLFEVRTEFLHPRRPSAAKGWLALHHPKLVWKVAFLALFNDDASAAYVTAAHQKCKFDNELRFGKTNLPMEIRNEDIQNVKQKC
jgi:hypothetical protein